jgi:hypothetical protein
LRGFNEEAGRGEGRPLGGDGATGPAL